MIQCICNYKQAGLTPSFAPGYTMRSYKDSKPKKGPIQNQLKEIASKVKEDNFTLRSSSAECKSQAKRIEMSFYRKWKNKAKNTFGIKRIRKFSDNQELVEKPLDVSSPKKYAGNLSASSYDSS